MVKKLNITCWYQALVLHPPYFLLGCTLPLRAHSEALDNSENFKYSFGVLGISDIFSGEQSLKKNGSTLLGNKRTSWFWISSENVL